MQSNVHILEICIQSCYGKILLSCGIHLPGNISSGPYFTEAVAALRKNKQACSLLGEPWSESEGTQVGDEENWVTKQQAQVRRKGVMD